MLVYIFGNNVKYLRNDSFTNFNKIRKSILSKTGFAQKCPPFPNFPFHFPNYLEKY